MSEEDQVGGDGEGDMAEEEEVPVEGMGAEDGDAEGAEGENGEEADAAGGEEADEFAEEDAAEEEMIEPSPVEGKCVVRQRQGLKTAALAERFCAQLTDRIEKERAAGQVLVFEDFDISQNRLPSEQLEGIFSALADGGVHVERFRAFGCPTLDDQAALLLAGWLSGVTNENAPFEIHLSDCAITADGYRHLIKAIRENDAFPGPDPKAASRGKLPLYLRLENNYIDEEAIKETITEGLTVKMRKGMPSKHSDSVKVRLLAREDGSLQQKKGEPPPPEDVPLPRPIHKGFSSKGTFGGKGKGSSKGGKDPWRDSWNGKSGGKHSGSKGKAGGKGRDAKPPWQALPAPRAASGGASKEAWERPAAAKGKGRQLRSPEPKGRGAAKGASGGGGAASTWSARSGPYNAFSRPAARDTSWGQSGNSARNTSWDREQNNSRAPAKRAADQDWGQQEAKRPRPVYSSRGSGTTEQTRPAPTSKGAGTTRPAPTKGGGKSGGKAASTRPGSDKLPYPWEEHWSDEYQLHYFWNSKTGESSWERPKAGAAAGARPAKGGGKR